VSSKWDTGMSVYGESNIIQNNPGLSYHRVWWNSTGPIGSIIVQLRTAPTKDGLNSSEWYGPTGRYDYYIIPGTDINPVHKDANARWIQYRLIINTSNSAETPQLKDITITYDGDYVVPEPVLLGIILCACIAILIIILITRRNDHK
jgi:hypothetical protein